VNELHPGEQWARVIALCLCGAVYFIALNLISQGLDRSDHPDFSMANAVSLSFAQMELQAPSAPQRKPNPEPEILPEPEEADVTLEKVNKKPQPQPEPEPAPLPESDAPVAQVTQQAAAPAVAVPVEGVQSWLLELLEMEKYYPAAAERFGLTGTFDLNIVVDADGTILSADVLEGGGHRILRQALRKMLMKIIGRNYGEPVGETLQFEFGFEFE
jgi:outer membrane biosynthesis protein TonB